MRAGAGGKPCRMRNEQTWNEGSGELLLPGAPRAAGFHFCCPAWSLPRLSFVTFPVRDQLRSDRECFVIVGTYGFERFNGSFRPGKRSAFQHTSILVQPHQDRLESRFWWSCRVPPPGPLHLLHATIYRHSRANPALPI